MLESEAKLAASNTNENFVISWSDSGKAFRISDVDDFAETILPRYFRTKKFSSFQRNLNLVSTHTTKADQIKKRHDSNKYVASFSMVSPKFAGDQILICMRIHPSFETDLSCYRS